jgi:hypothetical protein
MKAIKVLLCSALCLIMSCKKDTDKIDCWFNLNPPDIYREAISSVVITYSGSSNDNDLITIQTKSKRSGCDIYPCSIDYGSITLKEGNWYVLQKFDLLDSSGKSLFYMSTKPDSVHGATNVPYLPFLFKATGRVFFDFNSLNKSLN